MASYTPDMSFDILLTALTAALASLTRAPLPGLVDLTPQLPGQPPHRQFTSALPAGGRMASSAALVLLRGGRLGAYGETARLALRLILDGDRPTAVAYIAPHTRRGLELLPHETEVRRIGDTSADAHAPEALAALLRSALEDAIASLEIG